MIRFLLVLLAFVSALLAFIFQEIVLFVASGGLLMVSVVLVLLQVREQSKRKNRLKLPNDLTPEDELRARGVLEIRPKARAATPSVGYAPPELGRTAPLEGELQLRGILEVREKSPAPIGRSEEEQIEDHAVDAEHVPGFEEDAAPDSGIPWSLVAADPAEAGDISPDPFSEPSGALEPEFVDEAKREVLPEVEAESHETVDEEAVSSEIEDEAASAFAVAGLTAVDVEGGEAEAPAELTDVDDEPVPEEEVLAETLAEEGVVPGSNEPAVTAREPTPERPTRRPLLRRRVEVDAHLPALQTSLGVHTICLIDVDTDTSVYRLRSIVSSGLVDHAGTEYPFAGFFLSDLLAETTVLDIGPGGLTIPDLRYHRDLVQLKQVIAAPVMKAGMPAAFLVAGFENTVDDSSRQAVERAAAFFSSLYALQDDHPARGDSPLARAKRKPPSLRLVKSNPKSSQSKIIAEEMNRARGTSHPLALALVCLDRGDEIARSDETTLNRVEEWMRQCLEQITPEGRIEYLGELGYGIIQLRDVSDVEGWVRRAQQIFRSQNGPVDAHPIVGVAMLSEGHRDPEDLQADAVRALRAAYETGDSTILVG